MFSNRILRISGIVLLALVVAVSFITPESLLSTEVNFIYSDLRRPAEDNTEIQTKLDPGNTEAMEKLPERIEDWRDINMLISGYEVSALEDALNADIIIVRGYLKNEPFSLPVKLLTLQSKSRESFHPPEVCYPAMGYKILEESYEEIVIPLEKWAHIEIKVENLEMFSTGKRDYNNVIRVKKLVIAKDDERGINRKNVILYFYLGNSSAFIHLTNITMVRASIDVLVSGSVDESTEMAKSFMQEAIPLMFGPREGGDRVIIDELFHSGAGGIALGVFMYLIPLSIIFYPEIRMVTRRKSKSVSPD